MNSPTSRFVEHLGSVLEAEGYSRVAGRLMGLLLVSEDALSLDELAAQLGVSKASVSVNTRLLEQRGLVELVTHSGDRRDYYRITEDVLARTMEQRIARMRRFREAIASARQTLPHVSDVVGTRLDLLDKAHEHMLESTSRALDAWRSQSRAAKPRSTRTR